MPDESRGRAIAAAAEVPPVTLRKYYEGGIPLKRLFSPVGLEPADTHDETRLEALLADLGSLDQDLRRTVKLASGRANLPRWLRVWFKTVVERSMGGALDPDEASRGFGLRRLFTRCREGLIAKDPSTRRRSYNVLRLSLVWVNSIRQLNPVDLAEEATRLVVPEGRSRFRGRDIERGAVVPLLRATSPSTLNNVLLSLRFWIEQAQTARTDVFTAKEEVDRLTAKASELQQDLATAREQIQALQDHAADLATQVASLSHELRGERNRRINEMRETKGRLQRLFDSELAPRLRGAHEALDCGPLAVDVALERLDRTLELLEEERPWLSSD